MAMKTYVGSLFATIVLLGMLSGCAFTKKKDDAQETEKSEEPAPPAPPPSPAPPAPPVPPPSPAPPVPPPSPAPPAPPVPPKSPAPPPSPAPTKSPTLPVPPISAPPPSFAPGPVADAVKLVESQLASLAKQPTRPSHFVGLTNCGATCYINGILQVLLHTPYLERYFSQSSLKLKASDPAAKELTEAFHQLFQDYHLAPHGGVVDTAPFIAVKDRHLGWKLPPGQQQDAQEFIESLIGQFHSASDVMTSKTPKILTDEEKSDLMATRDKDISFEGYSIFHRLFRMYSKTTTDCGDNGGLRVKYDGIERVGIQIPPSGGGLESLLTKGEDWDESEYKCDNKGTLAKRQKQELNFLQPSPAYAVFQLVRFGFDLKTNKPLKNTAPVTFPISFTHAGRSFSLYGVVRHGGATANSGHYTSFVRDSAGDWFHCDDTSIEPFTENGMLQYRYVKSDENTSIRNHAYLLFYEVI